MSNSKSAIFVLLFRLFIVLLFSTFAIVACGGGGGGGDGGQKSPVEAAVTILAQPSVIAKGASSTIYWTSKGTTSCTSTSWPNTELSGSFNTPNLNASTTYTVTCTVPNKDPIVQSATVTVDTGLAACTMAGDTNAISLSNVVSRPTGGVAPLAVFFDATGTKAPAKTTRPFHDLEYTWSFGDPAGGAIWANGSQTGSPTAASKNAAKGPVAAHVFESSGTYNVTLTVNDGSNTASINCPVEVQNPDLVFSGTHTVCISGYSDSSKTVLSPKPVAGTNGCPVGAAVYQQPSFSAAINSFAKTNSRVLFQRGDTFTATGAATAPANIRDTGPGTVGSFGSATLPPTIQGTGTDILVLSSPTTPNISDWRVMDLDINGMSGSTSQGVAANGGINQVTLLRLAIHDVRTGVGFSPSNIDYYNSNKQPGHVLWDQIAIVDSSITHIIGTLGYGIYAAAMHFSLLGNFLDDVIAGSHVVRTPQVIKGVLSNNVFSRQGSTYHLLKMHGPSWCNNTLTPTCNYLTDKPPTGVGGINGGYTEQVVISDNKFIPGTIAPWSADLGPQNGDNDERLKTIIVERNWFTAATSTQIALVINAVDVTVRNNICDMTGGASGRYCFNPKPRATVSFEPPPKDIQIFNNTAYSADVSGQFGVVLVDPKDSNITVKNNLAYAPQAGNAMMVYGTASSLSSSNNSSDSQIINTSPIFVAPTTPAGFNITGGSYAIGSNNSCGGSPCSSNTGIPVWSDFFLVTQPATRDLGAIIHY